MMTKSGRARRAWRRSMWVAGSVWLALTAQVTHADEVTTKGTVLRGKVTSVNSTGIAFEPEYGKGSLAIKWDDIDDVKTDKGFQILHDDEQEIYSPLLGLRAGKLQTQGGDVDVKTIFVGLPLVDGQPSFRDRMRSRFRYWDGSFTVGFNVTQSTVDSIGLLVAFDATRSKGPTRLITAASYRYARQKSTERERDPDTGEVTKRTDETILQDEWKGLLRGEYDFTPRIYGFLSQDLEYDSVESLSLRAVTKAGAGYMLWREDLTETAMNFVRVEGGGAYVHESFFGPRSDDYFAIAFGALAQYHLPLNSLFDWRFDYLPNVADWGNDYLLRTEAALTLPLFNPIDVKVSIIDQFDNTPAEDAKKNSLYFAAGLSVAW